MHIRVTATRTNEYSREGTAHKKEKKREEKKTTKYSELLILKLVVEGNDNNKTSPQLHQTNKIV